MKTIEKPSGKDGVEISIILPTYNRVALLQRAVASVRSQSFENFELIVINDASSDGTKQFLDDLAKQDTRIRPIHNLKNNYPDISKNLNEGLGVARGKYIARIDDDDYWCDDDKLKKQMDFLETHPDYVVIGGGTMVIDDDDKERFRYFKLETDEAIRKKALFANPFTHSTVMFRRDVAQAVGGYGDFKNAEDWDLWLKMGTKGKFYNFQEYFVRYLMNDNSKTVLFKRSQSGEILAILRSHHNEYPNFFSAYMLNMGQYCFSLLPPFLQKALYTSLSKAKRTLFSS
jgi:glycosyltransferase involved in cell wall biosynthesis